MSPVDPEKFDAIAAAISKKYAGDLRNGDSYEHPERLSTRSLALDVATGGGVPMGRISRFYGPYCLGEGTMVLMADLNWMPVEALVPGDEIIGFDEYAAGGRGQTRRLRRAIVEDNELVKLPSYRIRTDRGTDTVASSGHLWLVSSPQNSSVAWKSTEMLRAGDRIVRFADVWNDLSDAADREEAAYLGGIFDGEGWIDNRRVSFAQNPGAVLDRSVEFLRDLGFDTTIKESWAGKSTVLKVTVRGGNPEIMRFFSQVPTVRLRANAGDWWEGNSIVPKGPWVERDNCIATVQSVEDIGEQTVWAIGTSTKTLIADGLMSHNSSTKSLNGWNIVAEAQEQGYSCCYWNIEKAYDPEFVEHNMGVDTSELLVMEGTTIEEIGEKLEALLEVVHLHVIDSCSQAVSEDELNADVNAWRPGLGARAWGKVFRRINDRFDHTENTIILLDQVRTNIKTGSEEAPGGKMLDHASSMSVKFKKSGWLFRNAEGYLDPKAKGHKSEMNDQSEPDGIEIKSRVEKSRVCRPLVPATMRLDFQTVQFDRIYEYVEAAKAYGVVENTGGGNYYYPPRSKAGKGKASMHMRGEPALRAFIQGDITMQQEIRKAAIARARRL